MKWEVKHIKIIKKPLIVFSVLFFTLGLCSKVTSFTSASISNMASITVTDSQNALISLLPEQPEKNTKGISAESGTFTITNNTNNIIEKMMIMYDGKPCSISSEVLLPGEKAQVLPPKDAALEGENKITVYAQWKNGSAEIICSADELGIKSNVNTQREKNDIEQIVTKVTNADGSNKAEPVIKPVVEENLAVQNNLEQQNVQDSQQVGTALTDGNDSTGEIIDTMNKEQ